MLSQSLEDYLEAIKILKEEKKVIRVKDISGFLKVKNPSVVAALNILAKNGYVKHEKYGYVEFTAKGEKKAEQIYKKHRVIVKFLNRNLQIPIDIAKKDACKIEHVISSETYEKILAASEEQS